MATTIILVRHGETDWNRDRRFQGQADVVLNETGRAQVRVLAAELAGEAFSIAYTSPLRRAAESAEILAATLGLEVRPCNALMEVHVGSWAGLTVPEVETQFPDGHRRWLDSRAGWEDGETYDELGMRVVKGLGRIGADHPDTQVLAVTHGGPIRAILAAVRGLPFEASRDEIRFVENCEAVRVTIQDGALEAVH
ncbi:MAG: histidine phosphatase family protein [Actinobacteria bacterium]|nr:histidine phosphatase family protein [Actinomycetota bacterium]